MTKVSLRREDPQLVSAANRLKLEAPDGKRRLTDVGNAALVAELASHLPSQRALPFLEWLTGGENSIDG